MYMKGYTMIRSTSFLFTEIAVSRTAISRQRIFYFVGEKGSGSRILVSMFLTRGTVLATISFHSGSCHVFTRQSFRSARSEYTLE